MLGKTCGKELLTKTVPPSGAVLAPFVPPSTRKSPLKTPGAAPESRTQNVLVTAPLVGIGTTIGFVVKLMLLVEIW